MPRFAVELRKLRERAGSPGYRELARRAHYSATTLAQAARGDKLPSLQVTLAYARACGGDPEEWERRWRSAAEEVEPAAGGEDDARPPYVGLAAFQEEDSDRFFGRDRLVARLVDLVSRHRLVTVVGASGSGKSSLLRAGLVPAVRAREWCALVMTPGAHPLDECAVRLSAILGVPPSQLAAELAEHRRNLRLTIRQVMMKQPHEELVLVVDQFEEIFTLCADDRERARFLEALLEVAEIARVVLGIRADFYGHCARHAHLAEALAQAQVLVGPMSTDELRQAITQPAIRAGCTVETALVARLVADATDQPGVLPLLSHALLETWQRRRGNTLTLNGYDAAGGIQRAIARTAESVYAELDGAEQRLARQLFLRLTTPGEGTEDTKRRIRRDELDDSPGTAAVLDRLARARLITVDQDTVEVSHEALIRCWPRLREWLDEDREGRRLHRQLTDAAQQWDSLDRAMRLAKEWAQQHDEALTGREREFLRTSLAGARRRARRLRMLVALLAVLLALATTATGYAFRARQAATEQRDIALAHKVTGEAAALRLANPALAAQLGLAAYRLAPTVETRSALLGTFSTPYATRLTDHGDGVYSVSFGAGGRLLATAGDDKTARLWDVSDPHHPRALATLTGHTGGLRAVAFSGDGRTLATACLDGTLRLWDITDPRHPRLLSTTPAHSDAIFAAVFGPDGRTLATAGRDKVVRLWDTTDPGHPAGLATLTGHAGGVRSVAFGPDARTIATGSDDGTARLWDIGEPRDPVWLATIGGHDRVTSVAFSHDGHTLATAGADRTARLWDITPPRVATVVSVLSGHTNTIQALAFGPDGRTLVTAGSDSTVRLWVLNERRQSESVTVRSGHMNSVWAVTFSPDGRTLATASLDTTVRLEDLPGPAVIGHTDIVWSAGFGRDGRVLATASSDRTARLWDIAGPGRPGRPMLTTLPGHPAPVSSVVLSPDGRLAATGGWDGAIRLWDLKDLDHPTLIATLDGHHGSVFSTTFSSDGHTLATAGEDHTARLWDLTDPLHPKALTTLSGHDGSVYAATFSSDGTMLATASDDHTVRLWRLADPNVPSTVLSGHSNVVWSVAFGPDGRTLASASEDQTARLWDLTDRSAPRTIAVLTGHTAIVHSVAYRPDGRTLATAGDDHTVRIWDLAAPGGPAALAVLTGHTDAIYSVGYGPDGHTLATASKDQTARLWETDAELVAAQICATAHPAISQSEWDRYFPGLTYRPPCA